MEGLLSDLQIGAIRSAVSDQVNEVLLKPYLSDDGNEIRNKSKSDRFK